MSYNLKYRPTTLGSFFGNDATVRSLEAIFEHGDVPHAFLFHGMSGCGKTTLARIVAGKLGIKEGNIQELNAASTRGIDTARELISSAQFSTIFGGSKAYVLDEAHQLTGDFQNAILKIIEDCPKHVYFMFCSTNPEKIITTIRNRCTQYELKALNYEEAKALLDHVIKKEKLSMGDEVVDAILKYSAGCPRRLMVNLHSCKGLDVEDAESLLEGESSGASLEVINICRMLFRRQGNKVTWPVLMKAVNEITKEGSAEGVRRMMFQYFAVSLAKATSRQDVEYFTAMLTELSVPVADGEVGKAGLVYILGRIVVGAEIL